MRLVLLVALQVSFLFVGGDVVDVRSRRELLSASGDKEDNVSHPDLPTDLLTAADSSGSAKFPSSANLPPNSWLYKFPPWFLPGNPPPDGFHSPLAKLPRAAAKEFSMVDDGDVLIIDHFGSSDRLGLLGNVRVPGNSAFRDEVVQTVLDVKFGKSSSPSSSSSSSSSSTGVLGASNQVVMPQSALKPPQQALTPNVPKTLQQGHRGGSIGDEFVTARLRGEGEEAFITSHRQVEPFPVISEGEELFSKILQTDSTPVDDKSAKFRPSLPDVHQASIPSSAVQEGSSTVGTGGFRPSKLLSITIGNQDTRQHNIAVGATGPFVAPHEHHYSPGSIIENNVFKGQQTALLKESDTPQSLDHGRLLPSTGRAKQRPVPFLPGLPLPFLLQHGQFLLRAGRQQPPQVTSASLRQQPNGRENHPPVENRQQRRPGSSTLPTSIQDIISGNYAKIQTTLRVAGDPGITSAVGGQPATGEGGGGKWLWRPS